jgi:uncharacterized iron-regulated protein
VTRPASGSRRVLVMTFLGLLGGCAHLGPKGPTAPPPGGWKTSLRRDHPLVGRIWSVAEKRFVTPEELLSALAAARLVLLGEKHDNPDAHALQTWALSALLERGRKPAVVFEHLRRDAQPVLDAFAGKPASSTPELGVALHWKDSGWPAWDMFEPIFAVALDRRLPVVAGDLSKADLDRLRKQNLTGLEESDRLRLGLDVQPTPAQRDQLIADLKESHCGQGNDAMFARMVGIQWGRDAQLASSLTEAGTRADGAVFIGGSGHARLDRGAPVHLARLAPEESLRAVSFLEVVSGANAPEAYVAMEGGQMPFDYLYFTPRLDEDDPCAKLRGRQ